ncbi:MAG: hypothetical protein WC620_09245 [Methanoregula sp.]|jgi:hypothetical protein
MEFSIIAGQLLIILPRAPSVNEYPFHMTLSNCCEKRVCCIFQPSGYFSTVVDLYPGQELPYSSKLKISWLERIVFEEYGVRPVIHWPFFFAEYEMTNLPVPDCRRTRCQLSQ